MLKSSRLVILLEPAFAAQVKRWSKQRHQPVSALVRSSIQYYLSVQAAKTRMAKIHALKTVQLPLKGLEDPQRLEQALRESYRGA